MSRDGCGEDSFVRLALFAFGENVDEWSRSICCRTIVAGLVPLAETTRGGSIFGGGSNVVCDEVVLRLHRGRHKSSFVVSGDAVLELASLKTILLVIN